MNKLLIANRGEIACRIMRTCEELGIKTVAVYSEADRRSLHVETADQAVLIGPSEARLSYLDGSKIIDAAKRVGADAIHPGYGFLSENADFAQAVIDAGIIWVGPHPKAMREMGSKTHARRLAKELGVPVVPGYDGDDQSEKKLAAEAKKIGFPIMIKASAGGGGKGIRIVHEAKAFAAALKLAKQEAQAAFGDDRVIVERYVEAPRHVEVQVMGDKHGNLVHLFTRDCSIQRRHQKLIEEAPAPNLSDAVREAMHEAALTIARAVEYDNAGTVEFLYDPATEQFYFLEMNTRLQVEHPVTEEITYLDLVELQLVAARGDELRTPACNGCFPDAPPNTPLTQDLIKVHGSAIEARVCAEIPEEAFRPDSGTVWEFDEGSEAVGMRVDTGIQSNSEVPPYYDSLLAKAVGHGTDREQAIDRLLRCMDEVLVAGVRTNIEYLSAILRTERFRSGMLSTHFIDEEMSDWTVPPADIEHFLMLAAAAQLYRLDALHGCDDAQHTPWESLGPWRLLSRAGYPGRTRFVFESFGERHVVEAAQNEGGYRVEFSGRSHAINTMEHEYYKLFRHHSYRAEMDGLRRDFSAHFEDDAIVVVDYPKGWLRLRIVPRNEQYVSEANVAAGSVNDVVAPYPGLITEVLVQPGDNVEAGDHLVVMEAMKMIQHLSAQAAGVVKGVYCSAQQTVDAGVLLVEFEKESNTD